MTRAADTRARILEAATDEFSRFGIAGARVDRIAQRSGMSKPMIYQYFGGKDALFDAVFDTHVVGNADRVPFTANDLAQYAVRLFDDYLHDPALVRLVMWKRLEREPDGYLYLGLEDVDAAHLRDLETQQAAGTLRGDISAADIWSLVIAAAATWSGASITVVALPRDDGEANDQRRAALAAFVTAATAAQPPGR